MRVERLLVSKNELPNGMFQCTVKYKDGEVAPALLDNSSVLSLELDELLDKAIPDDNILSEVIDKINALWEAKYQLGYEAGMKD